MCLTPPGPCQEVRHTCMAPMQRTCGDMILPWAGSRPQTVPILTRLQELLECEQLLDEKTAELEGVVAELQNLQKVAGK